VSSQFSRYFSNSFCSLLNNAQQGYKNRILQERFLHNHTTFSIRIYFPNHSTKSFSYQITTYFTNSGSVKRFCDNASFSLSNLSISFFCTLALATSAIKHTQYMTLLWSLPDVLSFSFLTSSSSKITCFCSAAVLSFSF